MTLSVIVITKNEEKVVGRCLQSVDWADEVIVLDSGSTDNTVEICRTCGATVSVTGDWPGFGPQKNRALSRATGDWVLSLDADEWVSQELAREIREVISAPSSLTCYEIPRLSSYCGRYMRHSGWWPDYVLRLFRRGQARFSDDLVHERVIVDGPYGRLRSALLHESVRNLEEVVDKMNQYSTAGAIVLHARGKRTGLCHAVARGLWTFIQTYIFRAGFLDGHEGFMLAFSNAEGTYYKYLKLLLKRVVGENSGNRYDIQ
jgi:glycosyltransferase involved in cell wall biosynthesis